MPSRLTEGMARIKFTERRQTNVSYDDDKYFLQLVGFICNAIKEIRTVRRRRPNRESIPQALQSKHGLSRNVVLNTLECLLKSNVLYIKRDKGKESFFVNVELQRKLFAKTEEKLSEQPMFVEEHSLVQLGPTMENGGSLPASDEDSSDDGSPDALDILIEISDTEDEIATNTAINCNAHYNTVENSMIEQLAHLDGSNVKEGYSGPFVQEESTAFLAPGDDLCKSLNRVCDLIEGLNDQVCHDRKVIDKLNEENRALKSIIHQLESSHKSIKTCNSASNHNFNDQREEKKQQNLNAQWQICLDERRKKYEQYNIECNLNKSKETITSKATGGKKNKQSNMNNGSKDINKSVGEKNANKAVSKNKKKKVSSTLPKEKIDTTPDKSTSKQSPNKSTTGDVPGVYPWKKGTILVMGDSMLNGVDERSLSNNGLVKVRSFSGSTISDLQNYYMKPLLRKKPTKIILHIGTNDVTEKETTADKILDALLDLKKDIESELPECEVVISIPIMRTDKEAAGQMVESLNRKLKSLDLNIIDNNNITAKDLGRRGLHLNNRGISKFAGNILDKLHDI